MTRRHGRPGAIPPNGPTAPLSISAIRDTDAVVDALAARVFATAGSPGAVGSPGAAAPDGGDPAVRLLQSLILDVDQVAPVPAANGAPAPSAAPVSAPAPQGRSRRRGARTVMALGISTAVFGTTGVAAASGELGRTFERSIGVHQPSGQAHKSSPGQAEGTGRPVVRFPVRPADPAPSGTSGTSIRGGPERASRDAGRWRVTDHSPPRAAAAPERSGDHITGGDQSTPDPDQVPGRTPGEIAETPTGPDPGTTPSPSPRRDDDATSAPTVGPSTVPAGAGDGDRAAADPCEGRPPKTSAQPEAPGSC
ncbi:hypothetical protein [Actinomadura alba]|uniref:Uncharacterized protein n=1 Tax=Actinomadura alba TaxID=406431 RepID=A0ABR7LIV2_9ACTN|nr:hypothetical protein [Actinomadura alba]MBC6464598.1 hypothetical protein [Actinomadura alba]